jgi:hypothetical protein
MGVVGWEEGGGVLRKTLESESNGQQNEQKNKYFKRKPNFLGLETLNDLAK